MASDPSPPSFLETLKNLNPYVLTPPKQPKESAAGTAEAPEPESYLHTLSSPEAAENAYQLRTSIQHTPVRGLKATSDRVKVYKKHTESVIKLVQGDESPIDWQPAADVNVVLSASGSFQSPEAPSQDRPEDVPSSVGSGGLVEELLSRHKVSKQRNPFKRAFAEKRRSNLSSGVKALGFEKK